MGPTATKRAAPGLSSATVASPEEALELLRSEPDYDTLASVLRLLCVDRDTNFDIRHPTPLSAQLVQVLVTDTLPNYWPVLHEAHEADKKGHKTKAKGSQQTPSDLARLLACLRSVTGLSALAVRLRALLAEAKTAAGRARPSKAEASQGASRQPADPWWQLGVLVDVLSALLSGDAALSQVWHASSTELDGGARRRPLAQEFSNLLGGGRIVSLVAEVEALQRERVSGATVTSLSWLADGKEYSRWLTENIVRWSVDDAAAVAATEDLKLRGELLGKALRLGYPDSVIAALVTGLLLGKKEGTEGVFTLLLQQLTAHEQKKMLSGVLRFISMTLLGSGGVVDTTAVDQEVVAAVAGLIQKTVSGNRLLQEHLALWLLTTVDTGFGSGGIVIRRAAMAVVASETPQSMIEMLEKSMADFGDQLFIKHAPILQQEAKAQVLLLSAGYAHRASPRALASVLRSRSYLSAVSNRLSASQTRARVLGMVVGEALSGLVDDSTKKLDFHMDEMDTEDAKWYKDLVHMSDTVGPIDKLRAPAKDKPPQDTTGRAGGPRRAQATKKPDPAGPPRPPKLPRTTGFVIEEVDGSEGDDDADRDADDDLVPYAKPDSDAEDSDDEPTDRRNKPKAPVYIRDLIAYFRDTENYDKQRLALTTAPVLIRRKATYGTEVQQHALELASVLVSFQDSYEMEDFYHLRLQGMVALVVAQPKIVAAWFSAAFFEGDYSLAQRASILTALGVGARELAGLETSEYATAAAFPSKQLPGRVERLYLAPDQGGGQTASLPSTSSPLKTLPRGALDSIADTMTASFLGPIAAKAADEATGPDVLKLTSFKEKHTKKAGTGTGKKSTAASVATANTSAQLIATAFFFPLVARFQLALQAASASSARMRGVLFDPSLLSLYLKTIAVLLHAAGPSALSLPDMTAELWRLLLAGSIQAHCVGDLRVTHAVLFALMALLDVNEHRARDLCRDLPREVVQTRDWVLQVLEATRGAAAAVSGGGAEVGGGGGGGGRSEESEVQMLAAGTYIRLTEGMESYKNLLLGAMIP